MEAAGLVARCFGSAEEFLASLDKVLALERHAVLYRDAAPSAFTRSILRSVIVPQ
jgi:hypothetical protein